MAWFLSYYETNAHFKTGLRLVSLPYGTMPELCPQRSSVLSLGLRSSLPLPRFTAL